MYIFSIGPTPIQPDLWMLFQFRISFLSYPATCFGDSEAQEMVDEKSGLHRRARIKVGSPPML
jgi:hypothetical protein